MGTTSEFYMDEHIPRAVVRGLRQRGVDVTTVSEAGLLGATDEEHIEQARSDGRILVTQDADFLRLHAAGMEHTGIVFVSQEYAIGEFIRALMTIQQVLDAEDMVGHVEYI